ncbi:MAG: hypothetical protein A2663_01725 [Candidatus Buchananbacteria bacterium RIFCSPHIGHO2_01_FULL_46_12]|uniref:Uncharacterized protein n=2 Tax=Candidatus Buchananiibacteriota TaxID=1817903 RepID=A0A1G1Y6V6_9BACT|nr:MAG: hypothetical protein A2663_01725 [Candidatus Buchananbacteria bacterium RIFCSPHIGHO2_01_FULL_46_12]OGY54204.1 MAG: hypothetical protein A3B15_01310 [Candidatus Buchananbacteria bacterium RIFCSPLOWO2_01_FULL_45_31]
MQDLHSQLNQSLCHYAQRSAEELKNWLALWRDVGENKIEIKKSIEREIELASRLAEEISALKNNS